MIKTKKKNQQVQNLNKVLAEAFGNKDNHLEVQRVVQEYLKNYKLKK